MGKTQDYYTAEELCSSLKNKGTAIIAQDYYKYGKSTANYTVDSIEQALKVPECMVAIFKIKLKK